MVLTRSQGRNNNTSERVRMSDNESDTSFPEVLTREQMSSFDSNDILSQQNDTERNMIDRRLYEMNKQIGELTELVLALTQQVSSNLRDRNRLDTVTNVTSSRYDMVTGVPNPQPSGSRTTPPNGTPRSDDVSTPQLTDVMTEIHHLRNSMGDTITQPNFLQTQVPLFKGARETYNKFEYLLLNHLRPHAHKLTEEQKLNDFQSLLRDDVIEFWQTLTNTTEITLNDILTTFKKEYAKEELTEVSKFKFDQLRYDPTTESFSTFLANYKKVAKQAYEDKGTGNCPDIPFCQTTHPAPERIDNRWET